MTHVKHATRPAQPLWVTVAMWLGMLAVFSALVAPVTMLAEEVRTGKLGGVCSAQSRVATDPASTGDTALQVGGHCDWCASVGLAPPPLPPSTILPKSADALLAQIDSPADRAASVTGLPFSRGPPSL